MDPESRTGVQTPPPPPPLKNHKNIGFLSNTGPDSLENQKATKPSFNVCQRNDDGPLLVVFGSCIPPSFGEIKQQQKTLSELGTLSDKTFWVGARVTSFYSEGHISVNKFNNFLITFSLLFFEKPYLHSVHF